LLSEDAGNPANLTSVINASRVTIAGKGVAGQTGAGASPNSAGDDFEVHLHDSLIYSIPAPLYCAGSGAGTGGTVTADYSSIPSTGSVSSACTPGVSQTHSVTNSGLTFADLANRDFRPLWTSPLIDAGDPAALAATTDAGGLPRPVDGDGNGSAIRDVGAFEYQRSAPVVSDVSATPASVAPGDAVTFSASGADADPGEAILLSWSFDDGSTAVGSSVSHAFATAGTHTATVTVTDAPGRTATAQTSVTVVAPLGGGGPPNGGGTPPPDVTAPVLSHVKLSHGRLSFTLSEAAAVRVRFARRRGSHYAAVKRSMLVHASAGASSHRLGARLRRALKPGRYRLTCRATDAAGNRSRVVYASFRVPHR
jgi:PKD repeat protein